MSDQSIWSGKWHLGHLSGWGNLTFEDGSVFSGYFLDSCLQDGLITMTNDKFSIVAINKDDIIKGPIWLLYQNNEGYLYKDLEEEISLDNPRKLSVSQFTGNNVIWVYPDLSTTLVGHFVAGTMLAGREAEVSQVDMSPDHLPKLSVETPGCSDTVFKYDQSTQTHLTSSPMIRDPMERKYLDVRTSSVPGAGMGVFARNDLPRGSIVGYFNGIHVLRSDIFNAVEKSVYLVEGVYPGEMLDIPLEFQSWSNYQASSAHLINHNKEANTEYTDCYHPRFGHILCARTMRDISSSEELFVKYDVAVDVEGVKFALKTALQFGQMVTGKNKKEFVKEIRPYLKFVSTLTKNLNLADFISF